MFLKSSLYMRTDVDLYLATNTTDSPQRKEVISLHVYFRIHLPLQLVFFWTSPSEP